ncbi:GNAT superfamily N-acetyltransferase [Rhizobium sp. SG_E_25_P2]|uniref:GNAT family N-acetyltransferase n=1 Tax=Rhizobium sp. SG_E_25_P2 TaxID=2879942 RepID=UPI002476722C|nr:GNAT family N-acetyltransferase [Rhizobium sp. SG_E_25_P2]MDH6266979.1 GNAT superfamily N-acetyltransferase [Rhizobium sp. SG_E_25_P2]
MAFITRSATIEDLDGLLALYRDLNPSDPQLSPDIAQARLTALLAMPGNVFVGDLDGLLVSTATLFILPNMTRGGRPYGLIENVVSLSTYRGQGFGKAVVTAAIKVGQQADCYKVMLMTGRPDPAVYAFYQACGMTASKQGFQIRF